MINIDRNHSSERNKAGYEYMKENMVNISLMTSTEIVDQHIIQTLDTSITKTDDIADEHALLVMKNGMIIPARNSSRFYDEDGVSILIALSSSCEFENVAYLSSLVYDTVYDVLNAPLCETLGIDESDRNSVPVIYLGDVFLTNDVVLSEVLPCLTNVADMVVNGSAIISFLLDRANSTYPTDKSVLISHGFEIIEKDDDVAAAVCYIH